MEERKPSGNCTKEWVMEIGRKYTLLKEFRTQEETAYYYARKFDCLKEMTWLIHSKTGTKVKWTEEKIIEVAQECDDVHDLQNKYPYAYHKAVETGLIDNLGLSYRKHPNGYWTDDAIIDESHKYNYKAEFRENSPIAYNEARKRGLLDKMTWLKNRRIISLGNYPIFTVYVYIYEDKRHKVAYVGLTKRKMKYRDAEHKRPVRGSKDSLLKFCDSIGIEMPQPIILAENLLPEDAQIKEEEFSDFYYEKGYKLLNDPRLTGKGKSSLGYYNKWTPAQVIEKSKEYKSKSEFKESSQSAYNAAIKYRLLDKMTWLKPKKPKERLTKEVVFRLSHNYKYMKEFRKEQLGAYNKAKAQDWLVEMTWLDRNAPVEEKKWPKEAVFEESKKYNSKIAFKNGSPSAYSKACEKGWIKEMTWLAPLRKDNYWTKETVFLHSKECKSRIKFATRYGTAYTIARTKGWLDEMSWLEQKNKPMGFWKVKQHVMDEGKKYKNRKEFSKKANAAYRSAKKNGWIDEMTWFKKRGS